MVATSTHVYLVDNPELGVAKAGVGGDDRIATWRSRGWRLVACVTVPTRGQAEELEREVLTLVRESGYPPFLPSGFDGYSETFAGNALAIAEQWFTGQANQRAPGSLPVAAVIRMVIVGLVAVVAGACALTVIDRGFGFALLVTAGCSGVGFLLGRRGQQRSSARAPVTARESR